MNTQSPRKWCSTLESTVFDSHTPFNPIDGGLVCELVGKADLLSDNFHSKQSWESPLAIRLLVLSPFCKVECG